MWVRVDEGGYVRVRARVRAVQGGCRRVWVCKGAGWACVGAGGMSEGG